MAIFKFLSLLNNLDIKIWIEDDQLRFRAPKGAMTDELKQQIKERKAEIIAFLQEAQTATQITSLSLVPVARDKDLPLSFAQQRMWFLSQLDGESTFYNESFQLQIVGKLSVTALEQSINEIIRRHEVLRTNFPTVEGVPFQVIRPNLTLSIPVIDVQDFTETAVQKIITQEVSQSFNLGTDPLIRVTLLQQAPESHLLLITMHHIIIDGWSMGVFFKELEALYPAFIQGKLSPLTDLTIQYADFALWQREWLTKEVQDKQLEYWKQQLAGAPPLLELPTDYPRPPEQTFAGATVEFNIDADLTSQLVTLSQQSGVTLFMTLLTAFAVILHRYSGQDDICIGSPFANRNRREIDTLIGFFVNTLVLRTQMEGNPSFSQLLEKIRSVVWDAHAHQDIPFEQVVEALKPERSLGYNPLFQVLFVLENFSLDTLELPGISLTPEIIDRGTAKFDLSLSMWQTQKGLIGSWEYNSDIFAADTITRMINHFQTLLAAIVKDPQQKIGELPLLTESERHQLLVEWNNTHTDYPQDKCIHELFEEQVEKTPDAVAVVFENQQLTYQQLNSRANQLAHYLQTLGVKPETLVGICVERSLEMVIGVLGILKAGGAYVPLDSEYPQERLSFMLEDSGISVLLTQSFLLDKLPLDTLANPVTVVYLDKEVDKYPSPIVNCQLSTVNYNNLAYVIYTSGSTGKPKGVMIEHQAIVNLALAWGEIFKVQNHSRLLQFGNFSFDLSIGEIATALSAGACLYLGHKDTLLPGESLVEFLTKHKITHGFLSPSALSVLPKVSLPDLQCLTVGGEACPAEVVNQWGREQLLYNCYGPTESTVTAAIYLCQPNGKKPPIGKPIPNASIYILDANNQLLPPGIPGELYIAGVGLAREYLNRPELTSERFIYHPFVENKRLYKTGDLARYLPDGNIEFLGRIDHQVKIRGFRIELGEVEAALNHNPDVQTSCVIDREDIRGQKRLVAYVVPHQHLTVSISELRQYLNEKLPEYMMPHAFVILEFLPLTPNGKIDRRALPVPDSRAGLEVSFVLPRNQTEKILAQIWVEVLRVKQVGIYDNFFELGGDSILSIQILAKAKQAGLQLTLKQLFANQTIAQLAAVAGTVKTIEVKQELVTGALPLTPIQHWFFEQNLPEAHHFNQAFLLSVPFDFKPELLKQVLQQLLVHHDGLRLRFTQCESNWQQMYSAPNDHIAFSEIDLSALPKSEQQAAIEAKVDLFQASLNLSANLVQVAFFNLGIHKRAQLLIAIHHLAIDGVSWRILLEDLQTAYQQLEQGKAIQLPAKTTAFKDWSEQLTAYAQSQTLQSEAAYWLKETRAAVPSIPVDHTKGVNTVAAANTVLLSLSEAETHALLHDVPKTYNTQINDILLTTLALVLSKWTNSQNVLFNLEGHGREDIVDGVDLSRTIGWFTTIFPVVVELPATDNLADALKSVKEQLRAIPNKGIGYGLLRYLSQDPEIATQLKTLPQAEISFNYLGQFDQQINTTSWMQVASESAGKMHGLQNHRPYVLEIDSIIAEERLRIEWTYSTNLHHRATIENLAKEFVKTLQELIAHCALPESGGHTPSDFPLVKLNQLELDQLLASLGKNNGCNIEDIYPLSPMQEGILFESLYTPDSQAYFEQLIYSLSGNVNIQTFEQAWQQVVARHSILRTAFVWQELAQPLQLVDKKVDVKVQTDDWRSLSPQQQQQKLEFLLQSQRQESFQLSVAPLMNLSLIQLSADRYQFVWNFHHLLLDGWSVPILFQNFLYFYQAISQGEIKTLPPVSSYHNYIGWLQQQDFTQAQEFWQQKLQGFSAPTSLTVDKLSSSGKHLDSSYKEQKIQLTAQQTEALQTFARQHQLTMNNLVQGTWALLLSRYSQDSDIVFGATVSGRPPSLMSVESMVGLFINTLPVRVQTCPETEVLALLKDLQTQQIESEQYSYSSLVDIQGLSDVPRGTSLFESLVVFDNYPIDEAAQQNNYGFSIDDLKVIEQTNYPLTVMVIPGQELLVRISYDISRFDDCAIPTERSAIARLLGHFQTLLSGIAVNPKAQISQLPLLTEVEKHQLLTEWNNHQTEYPFDKCIHQLFEEQAELTPHAIAVECGNQQLTYYELNSRANQLAHYLQSLGVKPDVLVGICVERSLEMVVGILGILKAGGAYVPLDPEYPTERLAFMLENAQVSVLLTQQSLLDRLPQHQAKIVCLDTDTQVISQLNQENPISAVQSHNLVYVVYTSGSTGKPKGVAMNHLPLCNLILWQLENTTVAQDAKTLQFAPISFDVSFQEIFSTWCSGGTLVLITEELRRDALALLSFLEAKAVARLFVPFVALQQLAEVAVDSELFATHLQEIITAGEQLQITPAISQWFRKLGNCTLHNHYGPSESHVVTAFTLSPPVETWPLLPPIGKAIANTEIYLLDQNLQPVPIGIPGELYIGGITLARGYLNRPDLTNEKFIPNPFNHPKSKIQNPKLYKTGDLARYLPDGNIEYLGRVDTQVKIRGFRIELGEVEAALSQYEDVEGCCVIAREDTPGNTCTEQSRSKRLVAYVVAHQNYTPTVSALRQFLKAKLPDYMIPSAFVILQSFPLTPSGKVDRRALPAPDLESTLLEKYVAPRTPIEELLTQIWAQVLKVEQVGIDDNFFELGGHSLLATQLVSRIRNIFQVELPLYELFTAPTVEELAYIIGQLQQENLELSAPPLLPRAKNSDLPMSFAQQRLWFLEQFDQKSVLYNLPTALRLVGSLQIAVLEQSLQTIIHRHEALRTNFITIDRQPTQVIREQGIENTSTSSVHRREQGIVSIVDLQHLPITEQEITVEQLAQQQIIEPFDLRTEALIRVQLVLLNDTEQVLLVCMHHIVADGWSMGVFVQELTQLYNAYSQGQSSPLTPLSIQYADFAIWQRQWLQGDVLQSQLSYWEQQLKDAPDVLSLPTDRPRPAVQTVVGATHEFALSVELTDKLIKLSQNQGCTLFMTLLAAYDTLLYRYTRQSDILVGSPIANRDRSEIEGLIGFFVNTLVMRTNLAGNPRFSELLTRVREMSLGAYAHQHLPFEMLVEALQPERDLSHTPLFQVMFNLQNTPVSDLELNGLTVSSVPFKGVTAAFDMTLFMQNTGNGLVGVWEYNTDLFDHSTIERVIGHFVTLLEAVVNNPQERIDQLPILTAVEQHKLLVEWNDTQADYPVGKCLHHLVQQQVKLTPDAVAVVFNDQQWTYQQLNTQANQLAHYLQSLGVGAEVLVGIYLERSLSMTVALLAVLKAGGGYVPLDIDYPQQRLTYISQDSQISVLITQESLLNSLPVEGVKVIVLDQEYDGSTSLTNQVFNSHSPENPVSEVVPENLACVLYTSGSTGKPKGVMLTHAALVNHSSAISEEFGLTSSDLVLQFAAFGFDVALEEIFPTWFNGGTVVLRPTQMFSSFANFAQFIEQQQITVLTLTSAYWHEWMVAVAQSYATVPQSLRLLTVGGDTVLPETVAMWQQLVGDRITCLNAYGPTEASVTAIVYDVQNYQSEKTNTVLIGRPVANTEIYILDSNLQPVPIGVKGELYIGGERLARGYFNRPELTQEKFIPHPFNHPKSQIQKPKLYKTGDLARYLPDGNIEFIGRIDDLVKIRGFRVALGEIESLLVQHPDVIAQAVMLREDQAVHKHLVAYVVSDNPSLTQNELQSFLKQKLPNYMIPTAFVMLEALPLTTNGKVDRRALPAPSHEIDLTNFVLPNTPTQKLIADIWSSVLGTTQLGIHNNFFDMGGNSLRAMQVMSLLRETLQIDLPLRYLFENPTVAELAAGFDSLLTSQRDNITTSSLDLTAEAVLDASIHIRKDVIYNVSTDDKNKPQRIFLTGVTGFLGSHLLYELLQQTQADIYCLIRATDFEQAQQKLQSQLKFYQLWSEIDRERIIPVVGDLGKKYLGLSISEFQNLAGQIDVIYHCGAWINVIYPYSVVKPANVLGTQEIIRLASEIKVKPLHFISTTSVLSASSPNEAGLILESDNLEQYQTLDNGYIQSKWVAEKLVMQARDLGLPVAIYRASRITGNTQTGISNTDDLFCRLVKGCLEMRVVPDMQMEDNLTPVDYVSKMIVHLSGQKESLGKAFHLVNPKSTKIKDLFNLIRSLGYPIQMIPVEQWHSEISLNSQICDADNLRFLSHIIPKTDVENSHETKIDYQNMINGLGNADIMYPALDPKLLKTYISYFISSGFIDDQLVTEPMVFGNRNN
ncbi:MAG: amino acid adenylation domain-containing protein [Dolichospermum sp. JUN01]|nr:amino acid adenylation domain-containing protein [Dolichospermum sp. JUN01]MBS9392084.1 amino acid adenylation domain-containing protein [Dolichospermum sp. OL01]MCO5795728.1 amino acid adenylation domain-containing protein [Dolichospermum sp. OL03]MCS6280529.1 amino acid adenylation domain-containing protein [Dolichospermum sp.]QSV57406.1 MAG: amino acid adenylation domain-containing protein [Dolichospermum sp. LBC05a]